MSTESTTPPHHPTYNVKLSQTKIAAIIDRVYPSAKLTQCQQLARGQSFNNRIYFLDVETADTTQTSPPFKLVLKLCGQYFGSRKVQNEVGVMQLLEHFCPNVPTAKIVAWSEDGKSISVFDKGERRCVADAAGPHESDHSADFAWVMQVRLPGRLLTFDDLDGRYGSSIMHQLATYMATWRTAIPNPGVIGNLRFAGEKEAGLTVSHSSGVPGLAVGGLVLTNQYDAEALSNWAECYKYRLHDQYVHLTKTPVLSSLRASIEAPVLDFITRLSTLPFLSNTSIRFSHMDFCPRNTLVWEDAAGVLRVSGILDFEFSAFLPAPAEFLNTIINQADDWPAHHYRTIMGELQTLERENFAADAAGQTVDASRMDPPEQPCADEARCLCSYHALQHLGLVEGIIEWTAPWWIGESSHGARPEELERECAKAREVVLGGIETLSVFWKEDGG